MSEKKSAQDQAYQDAWKTYNEAKENIKNKIEEWASHLGVDEINIVGREEYNDNNYYTAYSVNKVMGVDCSLETYYMDEEFTPALKAFKEAVPPNSFKFITDQDKTNIPLREKIEELKEEYEEGHIDILIKFAERGIDLEEGCRLLYELCELTEDSCPNGWYNEE